MLDNIYHELSPVINDVVCLMSRFKSIEFKHIPHGANKVAHCLAQYALSMTVGHKMFFNPPPFSRIAYQRDIEGLKLHPGAKIGGCSRGAEWAKNYRFRGSINFSYFSSSGDYSDSLWNYLHHCHNHGGKFEQDRYIKQGAEHGE